MKINRVTIRLPKELTKKHGTDVITALCELIQNNQGKGTSFEIETNEGTLTREGELLNLYIGGGGGVQGVQATVRVWNSDKTKRIISPCYWDENGSSIEIPEDLYEFLQADLKSVA